MTPDGVRNWARRNRATISVGTAYLPVGERRAVIATSHQSQLVIVPHAAGAGLYRQDFDRLHAYWDTRYITALPQYTMLDVDELRKAVFG